MLRWATLALAVLALWLSYGKMGAPYVSNDGYQYLDAASSLASGSCFCTRVALFDEQIAFGRMPIPFTHFAPGYPLLIAGFSRLGIKPETAGYLLSAIGYLAVLWLIWDVGLNLGSRPWVVALFSLLWIASATALYYAAMVGTESLFAALMLATVALIIRDLRLNSSRFALTASIGIVAALSYWIRYPGLFLIAAAGIYLLTRAWLIPKARPGALAGIVASVALVAAVLVRNAIYTGSWRGGFNNPGRQSPVRILVDTGRAFSHLFTGDRVPLHVGIWTVLLLLSSAALAIAIVRAKPSGLPFAWSCIVGLIYTGGVLLAALTTIASDFGRYYFPVFPLLLALLAAAVSLKPAIVPVFVISALAVEAPNLFVAPEPPDWILTRTMLSEDAGQGVPLLAWLEQHVQSDQAIVAVEGQAIHYISHRPVAAAIEPRFTARATDANGYRNLMRQYGSRYLIIFPNAPPDRVPEQDSTGFLKDLAAGISPGWLKLAARTRDAAVYECADCSA